MKRILWRLVALSTIASCTYPAPRGPAPPSNGNGGNGANGSGQPGPVGTNSGGGPPSPDGGAPASAQCKPLKSGGATSKWVYVGADGKLAYGTLPTGERLLDYSYAGYHGGGVALPTLAALDPAISPSGGDDTAAIQAEIDTVSHRTPDAHGFRGVVALAAGTFTLAGSLNISAGGVVLRGAGADGSGTLINLTGMPRTVINIAGNGKRQTSGTPALITDAYVPSGATSFHVDNPAGLTAGTPVLVGRPVTAAWVHFMGMDTLVRNGVPQTWLKPGDVIQADRTVTAVNGNQVTVDVPLSDSFDAQYVAPGATVVPYSFAGRIAEVGLEGMHVVAPPMSTAINQATFELLHIDAVINGWVKGVSGDGFINGMSIGGTAKWITVEDTAFLHTAPINGSSGYPADFSVGGQQVLFNRCSSQGDHVFAFVTQATDPGPNVVLNMTAHGNPTNLAPHQRWATGLLLDNIVAPTGGVDLQNRATAGSGQGWAIGFGVVFNSTLSTMLIEQPPGAQNWAIGSSGMVQAASTGAIDSPGAAVDPKSLYLAQLCERLGPQALTNIGY
jgi:hypothetical protein